MIDRKLLMTMYQDPGTTSPVGPGPDTLILGDMTAGYYGTVASTEVFSASQLRTALGVTTGTIWNDTPLWAKFAHNGLIKYIPMAPLAYSLTWQALYLAGAVYPSGPGNYPPTGQPVTQQGKQVMNGQGYKFSCALISTGTDPVPVSTIPASTSEYALINRLMNGPWGTSTYQDWGVNNFSAYMWIMQSLDTTTNTKLSISYLANNVNGYSTDPNDNRNILHWRPILTLQ